MWIYPLWWGVALPVGPNSRFRLCHKLWKTIWVCPPVSREGRDARLPRTPWSRCVRPAEGKETEDGTDSISPTTSRRQHANIQLLLFHHRGWMKVEQTSRHLVCVEGSKHVLHVRGLFLCGVAADAEDPLEFVQVQISTRTLGGELAVEFLDVLKRHFLVRGSLCLAHHLEFKLL